MSVIITESVVIGPFSSIEILSDRLNCDGVHYPFTVIGSYTLSDDDALAPPQTVIPVDVVQ